MPINPVTAAQWASTGAGMGLSTFGAFNQSVNNQANIRFQQNANRDNRNFDTAMYFKKRKDALDDFAMQNAYNSPEQQMARLKAAGLNPHLIYGHGSQSASGNSSPVRDSSSPAGKSVAPHSIPIDVNGIINTMNNVVNALVQRENTQANTANIQANTKNTLFELGKKFDTRQADVDRPYMENRKLGQDIAIGLEKHESDMLTNSQNRALTLQKIYSEKLHQKITMLQAEQTKASTAKSYVEIDKIKQDIENLKQVNKNLQQDFIAKEFTSKMAKLGISPYDDIYDRVLMETLGGNATGFLTAKTLGKAVDKAVDLFKFKSGQNFQSDQGRKERSFRYDLEELKQTR